MQPLIVIPARGGSKGVPGKNIKLLGGKPLIEYTIDSAKHVSNNIIVSTDSEEIKSVVENLGISITSLRPKELSSDTAGTYEVLRYEIEKLEEKGIYNEILVLLQPTSPFRKGFQVQEALNQFHLGLDMVVSVKETKANPYFLLKEEDSSGFLVPCKKTEATRRQDASKVWELNGAIYVINVSSLKREPIHKFSKVKKYVMDEITSLDIDTNLDWVIAEALL